METLGPAEAQLQPCGKVGVGPDLLVVKEKTESRNPKANLPISNPSRINTTKHVELANYVALGHIWLRGHMSVNLVLEEIMGTLTKRVGWKEDPRGLGMMERCWGSGFLWGVGPCGTEEDPRQSGRSGKDSPGGGI